MHRLERIALWTVIVLIIFFLVFRNSSGFMMNEAGAVKMNMMSMSEYAGLPDEIKKAYAENATLMTSAYNTKFKTEWNKLTQTARNTILNKLKVQYQNVTNDIATKNMSEDLRNPLVLSALASSFSSAPAPVIPTQALVCDYCTPGGRVDIGCPPNSAACVTTQTGPMAGPASYGGPNTTGMGVVPTQITGTGVIPTQITGTGVVPMGTNGMSPANAAVSTRIAEETARAANAEAARIANAEAARAANAEAARIAERAAAEAAVVAYFK